MGWTAVKEMIVLVMRRELAKRGIFHARRDQPGVGEALRLRGAAGDP